MFTLKIKERNRIFRNNEILGRIEEVLVPPRRAGVRIAEGLRIAGGSIKSTTAAAPPFIIVFDRGNYNSD